MGGSRNSLFPELADRVGAFVADRCAGDQPLCIGLSGGCDSVLLTHLLAGIDWPAGISAIHVNHGLSPHADAWADFCVACCGQLGLPLQCVRVEVDRHSGQGLEAAARTARYAAFAAHLPARANLLLAQHRGDQAETVLFNLLRGSGVAGAAGMWALRLWQDRRILRPLLGVSRAAIEAAASERGLHWIEDESNADLGFSRNFLRHQVMPLLGERFSGAEAALARAADNFREAAELLDELAAADWQRVSVDGAARLADLRTLSPARLKNLLRWRMQSLGWQLPVADRLDEFVRQLMTAAPDRHPELCLPAGRMRLARGWLAWLPRE